MFKNVFHTNPEDSQKINTNNKWEIEYWCNRLHVTEDVLKKAIRKAGKNIDDIKKELNH